ncbi:MAG: AAA family ATPase [Phycisphaerales bacterium]|nr:AAA family ATPase [Phycisphaerales bacterium]
MVARSNLPPPELRSLPTPTAMFAHLDRLRVGQSRAKRDLAVAVCNHCLAQAPRDRTGEDLGRHHLLLGPTGVGKGCMVRRLTELLDVPLVFAAATHLVEVGYRGSDGDDLLRALLAAAHSDPRRAEHGIVCRDEIDKVRSADGDAGRDVSGEGVRNVLLTRLDGRIVDGSDTQKHTPMDSGRLTPAPQHARTARNAFLVGAEPKGPYTDTAGWTDAHIWRASERTLSTRLDWNVVTTQTLLFWRRVERQRRKRPRDALRVTEELRNRRTPLGDFCLAATSAGNNSLPAILHYLDCRLERTRDDAGSDCDGAQPGNAG